MASSVPLVAQTICLMHPRYEDNVAYPKDVFDKLILDTGLKAMGIYTFGYAGYIAMGIESPKRLTPEELCAVETTIRAKGIATICGALAHRRAELIAKLSLIVNNDS